MNERKRLIELIRESVGSCAENWAAVIADYLLENGVIVLPCKIGTEVYWLTTPCGECGNNYTPFIKGCRNCSKRGIQTIMFDYGLIPELGKEIFLTREEAEKALEGGTE